MADVLYFASGLEGQWELSDGERQIGGIVQVGTQFRIQPSADSILEEMEVKLYPSKQEAMAAIEVHTGAICKPLESA